MAAPHRTPGPSRATVRSTPGWERWFSTEGALAKAPIAYWCTAALRSRSSAGYRQVLTAAGVQAGANGFRISDTGPDGDTSYSANFPSVAYNSAVNRFLMTSYSDDDSPPLVDNELEIFGQRLDRAGVELGANDLRISDMGPDGNPSYNLFCFTGVRCAKEKPTRPARVRGHGRNLLRSPYMASTLEAHTAPLEEQFAASCS
jgi:hypothetical protein